MFLTQSSTKTGFSCAFITVAFSSGLLRSSHTGEDIDFSIILVIGLVLLVFNVLSYAKKHKNLKEEKAIDPEKPYLSQRKYALLDSQYTKPVVKARDIRWGAGFHRTKNHSRRGCGYQ